ncbi:conserved protein of unknown function [Cupriavidus taiwanensis]|nr:conserved protein of unknown function [Cupriavidus taiwanensis]
MRSPPSCRHARSISAWMIPPRRDLTDLPQGIARAPRGAASMPGTGVPARPVPSGPAVADASAAAMYRTMQRPVPAGARTESERCHPFP